MHAGINVVDTPRSVVGESNSDSDDADTANSSVDLDNEADQIKSNSMDDDGGDDGGDCGGD